MIHHISLAYGQRPLPVALPAGSVVVQPPPAADPGPVGPILEGALDKPIGSGGLEAVARSARRITVIVSDATRAEPRGPMLAAILRRLPDHAEITIAIATGTHGPCDIAELGLPEAALETAALVNHDGHDDRDLVLVGTTARGTPVRVHRCVADTDLIVATGGIKPHYFAGFGAGCKAVFPGLGANAEIRRNHLLKRDPRSTAGSVQDNPCRLDLEEATALLHPAMFLLNVVFDADGRVQAAVAGDIRAAFEAGAALCDPLFRVTAQPTTSIVVSDRLPVTGSVYQASKLVAAVAPVARSGVTIIVAAQCPFGTGPVRTVNEAIYDIGLRPRLPNEHKVVLVSDLSEDDVAPLYCEFAPTIEVAMARLDTPPTVFTNAGTSIVDRA